MVELVPRSVVVYTPSALARAMVRAIGDNANASWLDPCVGDGSFVEELAALDVPKERITAFDINPNPSPGKEDRARTHWNQDFIKWILEEREPGAFFERIILNPPYVALSQIDESLRKRAVSLETPYGSKLSLKANYWCAFLIASLKVLEPGGSLCAVLPAAWDYAYYAQELREHMRGAFAEFMELRSGRPLFGGIQEGSVVIVGRGFGAAHLRSVRIEVRDSAEMEAELGKLVNGSGAHVVRALRPHAGAAEPRWRLLREVADIRIGAVTGDARYFILSESQRIELELPMSAVRPVLSRANHLTAAMAGRKLWEQLRDDKRRIWLFWPRPSMRHHPAVKRYLLRTEAHGGCRRERYKIKDRKPWYITPLPGRVDGFISGMSKRLPFLVVREKGMPLLTATNTLYVLRFKQRGLSDARKAAWGVALLSSRVRRQMAKRARVYADGLLKLEPSELGSLEIPEPPERPGAVKTLKEATRLLLAGQQAKAEEIADTWLGLKSQLGSALDVLPGKETPRRESRVLRDGTLARDSMSS